MRSNTPISMRRLLSAAFLCFSLPAMALLLVLSFFTVRRQSDAEIKSYQNSLATYASNLERTLYNTNTQLSYTAFTNPKFQIFSWSDSLFEKHSYAYEIMSPFTVILNQEQLIGGFFLYSASPSYYYPNYQIDYPYEDKQAVYAFLSEAASLPAEGENWAALELSDRLVLIRTSRAGENLCAAMIDPALDQAVTYASNPQEGILFFYATKEGEVFYPKEFQARWEEGFDSSPVRNVDFGGRPCCLIKTPVKNSSVFLCCLIPRKGFWHILSPSEKIILLLILLLFCLAPFLWMALYKQLLGPLTVLSSYMNQIADGNYSLLVPENQKITELQDFSHTLNHTLQSIRRLREESYECKLDLQQAQLQYLHLQIRPHFYINCLNNIYSLAKNREYGEIQEMILSLSDYFRYVFRNSQKLVTLTQELHCVKSYIHLRQKNFSTVLSLTMDIDAASAEILILPLSLLTFVENSVQHSRNLTGLTIHIRSCLLTTPRGSCLNLTVSDNNGGFSAEDLEYLNHIGERKSLYDDYHVGISNIYYRMKLTWHQEGMLFFYNQNHGSCVEIIIPAEKEEKPNDHFDC